MRERESRASAKEREAWGKTIGFRSSDSGFRGSGSGVPRFRSVPKFDGIPRFRVCPGSGVRTREEIEAQRHVPAGGWVHGSRPTRADAMERQYRNRAGRSEDCPGHSPQLAEWPGGVSPQSERMQARFRASRPRRPRSVNPPAGSRDVSAREEIEARRPSASAECLGPVVTVGRRRAERVADAGRSIGAVHDVRAVAGAVHPAVDDGLRDSTAPAAMFSPSGNDPA